MEKEKVDGMITINGNKGIWTLDQVLRLLSDCNIRIRISLDLERDIDYVLPEEDRDRVTERDDLSIYRKRR